MAVSVNNVTVVAARTSVIATGSLSGRARVVVVSRSASARRRVIGRRKSLVPNDECNVSVECRRPAPVGTRTRAS